MSALEFDPTAGIRIDDTGEEPLEYAIVKSARAAEVVVDGVTYRVLLPGEMVRPALPN